METSPMRTNLLLLIALLLSIGLSVAVALSFAKATAAHASWGTVANGDK